MYRTNRATLTLLALLSGLLLTAGCLGKSSGSSFFTLTPLPETAATQTGAGPCLALGIGPVELPAYLERPQMVSRLDGDQFNLAEFDRWAEPLPDTVSRVLAEDLSKRVCAQPLYFYPWNSGAKLDRQVTVRFLRLDGVLGGEVVLQAHWSILDRTGKNLAWRASTLRRPCADGSFGAYARAMSELLADLSTEIAKTLTDLPAPSPAS